MWSDAGLVDWASPAGWAESAGAPSRGEGRDLQSSTMDRGLINSCLLRVQANTGRLIQNFWQTSPWRWRLWHSRLQEPKDRKTEDQETISPGQAGEDDLVIVLASSLVFRTHLPLNSILSPQCYQSTFSTSWIRYLGVLIKDGFEQYVLFHFCSDPRCHYCFDGVSLARQNEKWEYLT